MSYRDNEFYRSVGDGEPTLLPEYQADELLQGTEWSSGVGDDLPTCKTEVLEETAPETKKKGGMRKAVKMLKLTAAAVVTATVAVGSFSGGGMGVRGTYRAPTQEWPSITYSTDEVEESAYVTVYSANGRQSNVVQFNVGGRAFRLEDPSKALSFLWANSIDNEATLLVRDHYAGNSYSLVISGKPFSAERKDSDNAYGTISSTTGDVFYIETVSHYYGRTGVKINTSSELSALMHQLVVRSHITAAYDGGWGNLLIGDKLYSDINVNWSGLDSYWGDDESLRVSFDCCYRENSKIDLSDHLGSVTVNGIEWNIYRQLGFLPHPDDTEAVFDMLWFSPSVEGENCIIGLRDHLFYDYYIKTTGDDPELGFENATPEMVAACAEELLTHYRVAPDSWRW